jgi:pimeloyl-ACP methyl ester carboxylesterase
MPAGLVDAAVRIPIGNVAIDADLHVPEGAAGLVVFAHGSGSSRFSRRNKAVARVLEANGFGTLLLDLLTAAEEVVDERTREHRFDIELLGRRVLAAVDWTRTRAHLDDLPLAIFGASTGAAAALIAAAERPQAVRTVVSRAAPPTWRTGRCPTWRPRRC